MIERIFRVLANPKPYLKVAWMRYVLRPVVWRIQVLLYRKFLLPRLVIRVSNSAEKDSPIRVLFLAMTVSYWKYDTVYRRMANDPRFEPIIMPAMRTGQSLEDQIRDHDQLVAEFRKRGYNIVPGYDKERKCFCDARQLKPDIVFYTHPYSGPGRLRGMYDFWAMRKSLICFMPYFFMASFDDDLVNNPIQNLCWQLYCPNEVARMAVCRAMDNHGVNTKVPGYMFEEEYEEVSEEAAETAWGRDGRKRIIWAPHHSIENDPGFRSGTFLLYCDLMCKLAERYADRICFIFKPHPVLFSRLEKVWGREKTELYYGFWRTHENTQLQEGDYLALFKGSDALIHDCGSFQREYLETGKPCLFLFRADFLMNEAHQMGIEGLAAHYAGRCEEDVVSFIEQVVLDGVDVKAADRLSFKRKYLSTPNGKPFSQNVIDEIIRGLAS